MKILLTGASSGIGAETAKLLLNHGHIVIGLARKKAPISNSLFTSIQVDLSDLNRLPDFLMNLAKIHPDIDALVLNAAEGLFGHLEQFSYSQIQKNIDLNLISHIFITKAFLPQMKRNQNGTLIYMGSEASLQGKPQGSLYCASKFALRGFVQSIRQECAKNYVRVCLINPGAVKTPFFNNLKFIHGSSSENYCLPEEIAQLVVSQIETRQGLVLEEINVSPLKKVIQPKASNGTLQQ
ncbi:MAG: Sepiapterin reductase [Chlamydiae bacterium]|nr:Sepiapterin reductase [Chlamydiota bacterium]